MIHILLLLPLASLICIGIWNAFGPGMILGWLGNVWEKRLPDAINKPLWSCPPCMASVHGTWIWMLFGGGLGMWLPFVLALSGLNRIVAAKLLQ